MSRKLTRGCWMFGGAVTCLLVAGCVTEPPAPPPAPVVPVVAPPPPPPPEPKEPGDWVEDLADPDPDVRHEAAQQLAAAAAWIPAAIPDLTEALADRDPAVRREAARALGRVAPWAATAEPALVTLLSDPDPEVRLEGITGLARLGSEPTIDALERSLRDRDRRVRLAAARALTGLVPRTRAPIPVLTEVLADGELSDRLEAVEILAKLGRPAANALVQALDDDDPRVRRAATDALWWLGPEATTALIDALEHPEARVRRAAVRAMRDLGEESPRVIPHLETALRDDDAVVRQLASKTLEFLSPESQAQLLVMDLESTDLEERDGAGEALADMGEVAVPALSGALRSEEEEVRVSAARLMRDAVDPEAEGEIPAEAELDAQEAEEAERQAREREREVLAPMLEALGDPEARVRTHAAEALGKLGPAASGAVDELDRTLREDENASVRRSAVWALGRIGEADPEAVATALPSLVQATEDEDDRVRARAVEAMGRIGPAASEGVEALGASLSDPDPLVRGWSAWALGRIGPGAKAALPALRAAVDDPDPDVREFATRALARIEGS